MKKIKVNDVKLAYRDEGTGKPLVFLHAFPLNQMMWDGQINAFAPEYRVVTFDWRGFGESEFGTKNLTMSDLADDLAELFNQLNIEKATICGLSMGGYVAFAFYRKYKEKVNALILSDTRETADTEEGKRSRYDMAALVRSKGANAIEKTMISKLLSATTLQSLPATVELTRAMIAQAHPEGIAQALMAMAHRSDSSDLLPTILLPTLLVVGSEDQLTPLSEAKRMSKILKNSQLETIYNAGHLPNLERPENFNRAISKFLNRL